MKLNLAVLSLALMSSPALAQKSPQALQEAFVAAVEAEDAAALGALYAADAKSYGLDGATVTGSEAIGASWAGLFEAFDDFSLTLNEHGHMKRGDNAAAWGAFEMTATPAGGGDVVIWNGRYTDVSEEFKDGWRYLVDHASFDAPKKEQAEAPEDAGSE